VGGPELRYWGRRGYGSGNWEGSGSVEALGSLKRGRGGLDSEYGVSSESDEERATDDGTCGTRSCGTGRGVSTECDVEGGRE
jgi:hypothetical protein